MSCCLVLWLRQVVESVSIYCRSRESLRETFKVVVVRHPCYWMHFFVSQNTSLYVVLHIVCRNSTKTKQPSHRNQPRIYLMILILDMEAVYSGFVTSFIHSRQMLNQYFTTQLKLSF